MLGLVRGGITRNLNSRHYWRGKGQLCRLTNYLHRQKDVGSLTGGADRLRNQDWETNACRTNTIADFGKVYRTIFQSKRQRLVFKPGVIMYIQYDTFKKIDNILKYIFTYIYICGNFWIDRYFRILYGTRTWRLRYTFLKNINININWSWTEG